MSFDFPFVILFLPLCMILVLLINNWKITRQVHVVVFCVQWVQLRWEVIVVCWYWWNWWHHLLFKLSFHKHIQCICITGLVAFCVIIFKICIKYFGIRRFFNQIAYIFSKSYKMFNRSSRFNQHYSDTYLTFLR